jgi:hypothetical protein
MAVSEIVSGSGIRYGTVFTLDADTGLPTTTVVAPLMDTGTRIEGIVSTTSNDPQPNRISFRGDDVVFAQDSLPPGEAETFSFQTDKVNFRLNEVLSGNKVVSYGTQMIAQAKNTNRTGAEPQVFALFYRQALDTDAESSTFGRLRQWHWRAYMSTRITEITPEMNADKSASQYEGTPTATKETPWAENFTNATWGAQRAFHIDGVSEGQPIPHIAIGDGTVTGFTLQKSPIDAAAIKVWVNGSLTTPSNVTTGANPSFTLGAAPANNAQVFAMVFTNDAV